MHLVQQALMLGAGFHNIDSCRLDAGMSQHIRQLRDIFFDAVKGPGEQVPQVVGKTFRQATLARSHRPFNSFQTVTRPSGLPWRDKNTGPA